MREFERKMGAICRAVAVKVAEQDRHHEERQSSSSVTNMRILPEEREKATLSSQPPPMPIVLDEKTIVEILGNPTYENATNTRLGLEGVAVGLAWTSVGGEVMVVEASKMLGTGELVLTGQLGDVMKESATLALSWIRSNSHKV